VKYHEEATRDALLPHGNQVTAGTFNQEPVTVVVSSSIDQTTCTDYSEEAIPERDPAYRLPYGTLSETQTIEHMSAAKRIALACCLEQLGMSPGRAALMASL
jgi:hypothetical protein